MNTQKEYEEPWEGWAREPLCIQMVEVGGAVESALEYLDNPTCVKHEPRLAYELLDLTIKAHQNEPTVVKELAEAKETLSDFFGKNLMKTKASEIKAYYDKYMNEYIHLIKGRK